MRVLGVDPGLASMGYGIVEATSNGLVAVDYGVLSTPPGQDTSERLRALYRGLVALINRLEPNAAAVELFVARNLGTALVVGQARGVALLAAAEKGIPVFDYTPLRVKQTVAGYGRGSKRQVQEMVRLQLGLASVPHPDDAADALAVAICHLCECRLSQLLPQR